MSRRLVVRSVQGVAVSLLLLCLGVADATEGFQAPKDVSFVASVDGSQEKYVVLLPSDFASDKSYPLMIALHGHGSDRWQFATGDIGEARAAREVAVEHGMIYVSPDYRAKTSWMGPKAEADLQQIMTELKERYRIGAVILVGASMGGSSSLTFTAMHPGLIQGVVSVNGTANHLEYGQYQEAIQASFGGTKQEVFEQYKRRSAAYWPERFTMPLAITTGGKDIAVPPGSVTRLGEVVKLINPKVLHIHRPETGHTTSYEDSKTAYEFVCQQVLGGR